MRFAEANPPKNNDFDNIFGGSKSQKKKNPIKKKSSANVGMYINTYRPNLVFAPIEWARRELSIGTKIRIARSIYMYII